MPAKSCPQCNSTDLQTDYAAGNVVCQECGRIVEEGILMSEVGFSEGAGGRVHVQGTFVSNFSTGIPGFRGRAKEETAHNVKQQGAQRIRMIVEDMHIDPGVARTAARWFNLAVDHKFTRGRRTEYILAACIYLQCRLIKEAAMLIDFSERLAVNVYELGATYLRLRSTLNLPELMPEIDPAIYAIRFTKQLSFGEAEVEKAIAADASRLIRRFKADWMTQGRRPAGVCGACLVIAARMNKFLRTPEEVAQVVKVSPFTIRRRLLEFAQSSTAAKTVTEFRKMEEKDVDDSGNAVPPSVSQRKKREERLRKRKEVITKEHRRKNGEIIDEDEEEGGNGEGAASDEDELDEGAARAGKRRKGKQRATGESPGSDFQAAIQAAAAEFGQGSNEGGSDAGDQDLAAMDQEDYMAQVSSVRDNPEEVEEERKRAARAFKSRHRTIEPESSGLTSGTAVTELQELAETYNPDEKPDDPLEQITGEASTNDILNGFDKWHDRDATLTYIGERLFAEERRLLELNDVQLRERVKGWISNRDAKEVLQELDCCERARAKREADAKRRPEVEFPDLDEEELEEYYVLDEDEMKLRARMWLNHNAKWLEEDKERQAKKAAYAKARGLDPNKPKRRKKRAPRQGPFPTAQAAIDTFASTKKFSSRLNYSVLQNLGLAKDEMTSLQSFDDDEKEDEKEDEVEEDDKDEEEEADDDDDDE